MSIFLFDAASDGNDAVKQVAVASIKRLKTLRHPNVLSFIDRYDLHDVYGQFLCLHFSCGVYTLQSFTAHPGTIMLYLSES